MFPSQTFAICTQSWHTRERAGLKGNSRFLTETPKTHWSWREGQQPATTTCNAEKLRAIDKPLVWELNMIELSKGGDRDTEINSIHFIHWQIDRKSFVRLSERVKETQVDCVCAALCPKWDLHKISRARSIVWARKREKCKKRIKKGRKRLISHNSRDFQLMNCSNKIDLFLFASIFTSSPYHTVNKPGQAESKPKKQAFLFESFTVPHSREPRYHPSHRVGEWRWSWELNWL